MSPGTRSTGQRATEPLLGGGPRRAIFFQLGTIDFFCMFYFLGYRLVFNLSFLCMDDKMMHIRNRILCPALLLIKILHLLAFGCR